MRYLGVLQNSFKRARAFLIDSGSVGFWGKTKTGVAGENLLEQGENQQQTQPKYGVDAEIQTRATLVGGLCSHHCPTHDRPRPRGDRWFEFFPPHFPITFIVHSIIRTHGSKPTKKSPQWASGPVVKGEPFLSFFEVVITIPTRRFYFPFFTSRRISLA